ncbi:aldehyde dehydrogenase family protein [Geodermatophilus sp. CPCC 205506]|uniref:aldehyde dehydrogenase family protein n=1 Tax=Geodermatophilus sp. CPCC 205506 TaxID=2936596 RepID=UPI003EE88E46
MTTQSVPSSRVDVDIPGLDQVFIAGEWRRSAGNATWDVVSPSTEEVVATVALPTEGDADAAVRAARYAFDHGPWPRMAPAERISRVRRFCEAMEARIDDLNRAWAWECGTPLSFGQVLNSGAAVMAWNASLKAAEGMAWEEDRGDAIVRREPTGTVLAILTYNGTVSLVGMKVVPALLAGCPVVVKHAPECQLTARIIADAAREADLPEGVLSFLPADTPVTQYLVSHPDIDMVTLTGSQTIAKDVVQRTSARLARTALELGGKSPAILAEDVDLDAVMQTLGEGATSYCGQVCVLLSRVLVPRARYAEVTEAFQSFMRGLKVGDPFDPETDRGPLAVERARARTEAYVAGAIDEGATVAFGGRRPPELPRGWYYEPTLLTDVTNDMTVAREEVFGPVTALIPYDGMDQAIEMANDSIYGLAASVYTNSVEESLAIARRLRSGTVGVNLAGMSLNQPFGGVKQSGWGRECGPEGIMEFTDLKQMLLPGGGSFLEAPV